MADLDADYEEFLQAFERPTQIYRYLRKYHQSSPCFLQRTLSYMRPRSTNVKRKSKKPRCRLNELRDRTAVLDRSVTSSDAIRSGGPLELSFLVFKDDFDLHCEDNLPTEAKVEVTLHKEGFRRMKAPSDVPVQEVSLGTFSVPCDWRSPGTQSDSSHHQSSFRHSSHMESTLVVPLGLFGFCMPGGLGVKHQKLIFKLSFGPEENDPAEANVNGDAVFCESTTSIVISPSTSSLSRTSSQAVSTGINGHVSPARVGSSSSRATSVSSTALEDASSPPAKRHCIAPGFSEVNGTSPRSAHSDLPATSPAATATVTATSSTMAPPPTASSHARHPHQAMAQCNGDEHRTSAREYVQRCTQQLSAEPGYSRCVPFRRLNDGSEEDGRVDWSQWSGELTQSSAACNRKVQPLLRKNRELRGLVLDDPPDNTGLPEFSYARGRRGYTKQAQWQSCNGLLEPLLNGSKSLGESPARTPTPPLQPSEPSSRPCTPQRRKDCVYSIEIPIADDSKTCLLESGHYEMAASRLGATPDQAGADSSQRNGINSLFPAPLATSCTSTLSTSLIPSNTRSHQQATWEAFPQSLLSCNGGLPAVRGASLRFVVTWPEGKPQYVHLPQGKHQSQCQEDGHDVGGSKCSSEEPQSAVQTVVYNFIYQNGQRQQAEACHKLMCPWCRLTCPQLYSLLKHLRLVHPRFVFSLVQRNQAYEIDVCLNIRHDVDFDADLHPARHYSSGLAPRTHGPQKRVPFTKAFSAPRRRHLLFDLKEFKLLSGVGSRLFFHCRTTLPVLPSEADEDSEEEELPPSWISTKMNELLDEFTDVNDGEKTMMKLWNEYILKHRLAVDSELPSTCRSFTRLHASTIRRFNLHRNFVLHLTNLCDFGLVDTECVQHCAAQVWQCVDSPDS